MLLRRFSVVILCLMLVTTLYHYLKAERSPPPAPVLPKVAPLPILRVATIGSIPSEIPYRRRGWRQRQRQ